MPASSCFVLRCKTEDLSRILADSYYSQRHIDQFQRAASAGEPPAKSTFTYRRASFPKPTCGSPFFQRNKNPISSSFPHHDRIDKLQTPKVRCRSRSSSSCLADIDIHRVGPPKLELTQRATRSCSSGEAVHMTSSTHSRTTPRTTESTRATSQGFEPSWAPIAQLQASIELELFPASSRSPFLSLMEPTNPLRSNRDFSFPLLRDRSCMSHTSQLATHGASRDDHARGIRFVPEATRTSRLQERSHDRPYAPFLSQSPTLCFSCSGQVFKAVWELRNSRPSACDISRWVIMLKVGSISAWLAS